MAAQSEWLDTNYYDVLGVPENATDEDIRRAYRKLARELHPDMNSAPAAERRFKAVTAAHEVIGDPDRRKEYDDFRRLDPLGGGPSGFGSPGRTGGTRVRVNNVDADIADLGDLGGLFGDVFGFGTSPGSTGTSQARSTGSPGQRGRDLSSRLSLPFLDAVHGVTTAINLVSERRPRTVKVRIPAGVEDGQTIRLPRRGAPGSNGGRHGDLYITVDVEPHPDFGRLGDNVTITVPVTYPELVLGTDLSVPTIDAGTVTVRVPPGTPSGRTLRVVGRGIPGTDGALLVTLDVVVPSEPTRTERDLIEQLAAASTERPRARWEAMA